MQIKARIFKLTILLTFACGFNGYAVAASGYVRGCYYTTWSQYRSGYGKFMPTNIPKGLCTHIMVAFVKTDDVGNTMTNDNGDTDLFKQVTTLKKSDPNLKVLLSYGGGNFGTWIFTEIAQSGTKRNTFVQSAITFLRKYNFDGLDLDWEFPKGVASAHAQLSKAIREGFADEASKSGKSQLLLTAAVSAGQDTIQQSYDISSMASSYDYIFLMSYDLHGSWESTTDLHAKLYEERGNGIYNTKTAADTWVNGGMPKKKLVIGIPTYSRGYNLQSSASAGLGARATGASLPTAIYTEGGSAAYWEICDLINSGGKETVNTKSVGAYMAKGNQWHGYDNAQTIKIKMEWIKKEGYGGAFIWALDTDDFGGTKCGKGSYPLLTAISSTLGGGGGTKPVPEPETKPTEQPQTTQKPVQSTTKPDTPAGGGDDCSTATNGFYRDPTDCSKFYQCVGNRPYPKQCAAGLYFDEKSSVCDYKSNAPSGIC